MDDSRPETETYKMAEPRSNTNTGIVLDSKLVVANLPGSEIAWAAKPGNNN